MNNLIINIHNKNFNYNLMDNTKKITMSTESINCLFDVARTPFPHLNQVLNRDITSSKELPFIFKKTPLIQPVPLNKSRNFSDMRKGGFKKYDSPLTERVVALYKDVKHIFPLVNKLWVDGSRAEDLDTEALDAAGIDYTIGQPNINKKRTLSDSEDGDSFPTHKKTNTLDASKKALHTEFDAWIGNKPSLGKKQVQKHILEWIELENNSELDLNSFSIDTLPPIFHLHYFNHLKHLHLAGNQFKTIPDEILPLRNLETLNLRNNHVNIVPENIGLLNTLRSLDVSHNPLKHISNNINKLKNLKILKFSRCNLEILPVSLFELNLSIFNLSGNNIEFLPNEIVNLKNLGELDLSFNKSLESLPENMDQLSQLGTLVLDGNTNLTQLPESIFKLKNSCCISVDSQFLNKDFLARLKQTTDQSHYNGPDFDLNERGILYDANAYGSNTSSVEDTLLSSLNNL